MSLADLDAQFAARLRVMRIIVLALALGVFAFLVIAVVVRAGQTPVPNSPLPIVTYVALGLAVLHAALSALVPGLIAHNGRRQIAQGKWPVAGSEPAAVPLDDAGKLCILFQTRLIIGAAILEGAALLLLVAYLLEGELVAVVTAGVLLVLLLMKFPTRSALEGWVSEQRALLERDRMGA